MTKQLFLYTTLFILLLYCSNSSAQTITQSDSVQVKAQQLLNEAVHQNQVVGVSAGYSIIGNEEWQGAAGMQSQSEKFETLTISRLASIAKTMTAIAILQLFEQEKLDLDASIQTYIPNFPVKKEGTITTRHLLNQTSGIGAYKSKKEMQNMIQYETIQDAVNLFKDRNLVSVPGIEYHYSSYGYDVLGLIIEKVSGLSYEKYIQKNIWEIADMQKTSIEVYGKKYVNKTELYHKNSKGKIKSADQTNLSDRVPGGGIQSCVADILKFGNALLQHKLITEKTFELMINDPQIRAKEAGNGYGMGLFLYGLNDKYGNVVGHSGGQIGCSSFLFLLPEINTSVVVLTNTSGAGQTASSIGVNLFHLAGSLVKSNRTVEN